MLKHNKKGTARKPQFRNELVSDAGPSNPKLANRSAGSDRRSPPAGVMTPPSKPGATANIKGADRDYFREPVPFSQALNFAPQPSITPERVTQSVRMRFDLIKGLTAQRLVGYLEQFRLGFFRNYGMFADMAERRDYQIQIVAPKRKKSVARHGYDVTKLAEIPAGMETLADEQQSFLKTFWDGISVTTALDPDEEGSFGLLVRQMLDAIGKHYAVHEIIWQPGEDGSLTARFLFCPLWWFEGTRGKLRFLDSEFQVYGRDMEPGEWLVTIHDGIMEACSVLYLFKWAAWKAWMIFLDRFGQPGVHGLTDAQKDSPEWLDFKEAVSEFSEEYATVTNRSCEIKLIEAAAKGGTGSLFDVMTGEVNKAITMLWRGGDLGTRSSQHGQGTGASLQKDETEILETDDAKIVEETLARKVEKFALAWKYGPEAPRLAGITLRTEPQKNITQDLQIDEFLLGNGCDLVKSETLARYNRSGPNDDTEPDDIIEATTPQLEAQKLQAQNKNPETGLTSPSPGGQFANADEAAIAETLREVLLPILDSVAAIQKIDDPELQRRAAQALLKNFPHLETVILHNKALANKLLPELTAALVEGLTASPRSTVHSP